MVIRCFFSISNRAIMLAIPLGWYHTTQKPFRSPSCLVTIRPLLQWMVWECEAYLILGNSLGLNIILQPAPLSPTNHSEWQCLPSPVMLISMLSRCRSVSAIKWTFWASLLLVGFPTNRKECILGCLSSSSKLQIEIIEKQWCSSLLQYRAHLMHS